MLKFYKRGKRSNDKFQTKVFKSKIKKENHYQNELDDEIPKALQHKQDIVEDPNENYIPKAFRKEKRKINTTKNKISKIFSKKIIIPIILAIIAIIGIFLGISGYNWTSIAKEMLLNEPSTVLDKSGNEIAKFGTQRQMIKVENSEMPEMLKNAYIAIEDERFYSHFGIDIKRTGAAIFSYIFNGGNSSFGGSTITQQLVKNLTGDSTDSVTRKVKEWWKAFLLETCLSKDEILCGYLNVIYVGPNVYGVGGGAKYYFNKNVDDLTLEECAFLAGINHSPNSYNPFNETENTEKITKRTKIVLDKMLELEFVTEDEYNGAINRLNEGLNFNKGDINVDSAIYSYHTDALLTELISDISSKKNISETFATNYLYMSGLTINSTQETEIQNTMEAEFKNKQYRIKSQQSDEYAQSAMVIIDHSNGQVVGCVGGLGEKTTSRGLNRATQSIRQTGSAIKPMAILGPALEKKIITNATIFDDTEKIFKDGYKPKNYDGYLGKITVRRAVESSQNIPFVEIMEKLKPENSIKYLEKMGITTLTEKDKNLALALGGLEKGISPLEMAAAYATIANDGIYIEPTFYTTILNKSGKEFLKSNPEKHRVFEENVSYVLKELLTQPVLGANGTARYCKIQGIDVAAKTGTTDDDFDRWLCGFTPYYTAATWFGYDNNETIYFNKQNPAGLIWSNVMKNIHKNLSDKTFQKPSWVQEEKICADTGKKANGGCPNTYTEYFVFGTVPGNCTEHKENRKNNSQNTSKDEDSNKEIIHENNNEKEENTNSDSTNVENDQNEENTSSNNTELDNEVQNNTNTTNNTNTSNSSNTSNNTVNNSNTNRNEHNTSNNTNTNVDSNVTNNTNTTNSNNISSSQNNDL